MSRTTNIKKIKEKYAEYNNCDINTIDTYIKSIEEKINFSSKMCPSEIDDKSILNFLIDYNIPIQDETYDINEATQYLKKLINVGSDNSVRNYIKRGVINALRTESGGFNKHGRSYFFKSDLDKIPERKKAIEKQKKV